MFKVIGPDETCYALVDTREMAEAVVAMKKLGRDGGKSPKPENSTKASLLTLRIVEVPDSAHPGFVKR